MKRLTVVLLVFLSGLSALAELQSADTRESLRGLTGVFVTSRFIDLQPDGLTTNGIVKIAADALHIAGIQADAKPEKIKGGANLSITVNTD